MSVGVIIHIYIYILQTLIRIIPLAVRRNHGIIIWHNSACRYDYNTKCINIVVFDYRLTDKWYSFEGASTTHRHRRSLMMTYMIIARLVSR